MLYYQNKKRSLRHYEMTPEAWPPSDPLPSASAMIALIEQVLRDRTTDNKIIVHCL